MTPLLPHIRSRLRGLRRAIAPAPPHPAWVQVEINNTCNLNCVMCPRERLRRRPRLMPVAEFAAIADKLVVARVPRVKLFLLGEPLLHPNLLDIIAEARRAGVPEVGINTNAARLSEDLARGLLRSGLTELVCSLDGATAETYEAIRRGARFDEVTANVDRLCRLAQEVGEGRPRVIVQTMVMAGTAGEIAAFTRRWQGLADSVDVQVVREYQGLDGLTPIPRRLPTDELRPCPALWEYLVILADGTLAPCCVDINGEMRLGRIEDVPDLARFWRGDAGLQALRRQHCRLDFRSLPLCADCDFINVGLLRRKAKAAV